MKKNPKVGELWLVFDPREYQHCGGYDVENNQHCYRAARIIRRYISGGVDVCDVAFADRISKAHFTNGLLRRLTSQNDKIANVIVDAMIIVKQSPEVRGRILQELADSKGKEYHSAVVSILQTFEEQK